MLHFHASNNREQVEFDQGGTVEFGRGPGASPLRRGMVTDPYVSRDHLRIEELPDGRIRARNVSQHSPVLLGPSDRLDPGQERELSLPARLLIGQTTIAITAPRVTPPPTGPGDEPSDPSVQFRPVGLFGPVSATGARLETIGRPKRMQPEQIAPSYTLLGLRDQLTPKRLLRWVETLIAVQRAAAGSPEFYQQSARALVELVGFDSAMILMLRGGEWEMVARHGRNGHRRSNEYSRRVVDAVVQEKRTFYEVFEQESDKSLLDLDAVVASPILGTDGAVIGIVYGARQRSLGMSGPPIGDMEAQVVQLLATSMEAGLARAWQEAELARFRHKFEHFFSPELAAELEKNPRLLDGQEREVTVLFMDIRGFSRLAERLSPRDVYRLAEDLMDRFTDQIQKHRGVVVDYAGDGILAMWNAPTDQPDHASLACRAALDVKAQLSSINEKWRHLTVEPLKIGIGLNTGMAQVGNAGSRTRVKYGPRGHSVNLGSRTENASKRLGISILLTGSTRRAIDDQFSVRRLCKVRAAGLEAAVDLFELASSPPGDAWTSLKEAYEQALLAFEAGSWNDVLAILLPVIDSPVGKGDVPTLSLLGRAIDCLLHPPTRFDPVMELSDA